MLSIWNSFFPTRLDYLFDDLFTFNNTSFQYHKNEDGSLVVSTDLPGMSQDDFSVELIDGLIKIKGQRKTKNSSYSVSKSFSIPEGYSADEIKAELSNGVLTLTLAAKQLPAKEVQKINVLSK